MYALDYQLRDRLIDRFLYERDDNCFFNALECSIMTGSLYRLEPSGIIKRRFNGLLNRYFKSYSYGLKHNIKKTLISGLKDDFARLETVFSFLGYHDGFEMMKKANALELLMVKNSIIKEREPFSSLKREISTDLRIERFKAILRAELMRDEPLSKIIMGFSEEFTEKFIKEKVMRLNRDIDGQMVLTYDELGYSIHEETFLIPKDTLESLIERSVTIIYHIGFSLYSSYCFAGLSDRVIRRYD